MNTVLLTVEDHIATVTLNRPEALNALNREMRTEFAEVWQQVKEDDDIRVAIVTGAGKAFCAGLDIKERAQEIQEGTAHVDEEMEQPRSTYLPWDCPKPTIAAVNGAAAGGGLGVAASCDFLIASEQAVFICSFAARGALNPLMLALLATKVPPGWASWMAFSAVRVDAQAALRIGLVNEVLPQAELLDRAYEMAERILTTSYASVLAMKEKLRQIQEAAIQQALSVDGPFTRAFLDRGQTGEGFVAFAEKRRAQFD